MFYDLTLPHSSSILCCSGSVYLHFLKNVIHKKTYCFSISSPVQVWDTELERTAEEWAETCLWEHGPASLLPQIGQNLGAHWGRWKITHIFFKYRLLSSLSWLRIKLSLLKTYKICKVSVWNDISLWPLYKSCVYFGSNIPDVWVLNSSSKERFPPLNFSDWFIKITNPARETYLIFHIKATIRGMLSLFFSDPWIVS